MSGRIHDVEADTGPDVVRSLVRSADVGRDPGSLRGLSTSGTDHAMYRLGDDLVVRVPRTADAAASLAAEVRHLVALAPVLAVRVPEVVHVGAPTAGYPYPWAVLRWVDGDDAWTARAELEDPHGDALAEDLARAVLELRAATVDGIPRRGPGRRGGPLDGVLARARSWLAGERGPLPSWVDRRAVDAVLAADAPSADDDVPYVPTHGDLIPGNLVVAGGRLVAVLDWGYVSTADPALDLVPAWAVLGPRARARFRDLVAPDDATWRRARANAVEQALGAVVYYTPRRHPLADVMGRTLRRVLAEADPGTGA